MNLLSKEQTKVPVKLLLGDDLVLDHERLSAVLEGPIWSGTTFIFRWRMYALNQIGQCIDHMRTDGSLEFGYRQNIDTHLTWPGMRRGHNFDNP